MNDVIDELHLTHFYVNGNWNFYDVEKLILAFHQRGQIWRI